ncbi:hypothetical protein Tcan_03337 [Toxocara canis]|uniref:HAT C-terminal dimerisation domain-containing protein n=1 Tax=Toxocara canis TaxID=6265 RepID=A0A0B2VX31_TOXCA|nr:hypothetical protein Tcan_03337 [Toxocara canis]
MEYADGYEEHQLYEGLVSVTKPIRDQSELLQGDSYVTISNVYPAMLSIKTQLDGLEAHEEFTVANVARCVNKEFKRRVAKVIDPNSPDFDPIYAVATVLDPNNACLFDRWLKEVAETAFLSVVHHALKAVALRVLSILASSAPMERVFSQAGIITGGRRLRMEQVLLEKKLFLHMNSAMWSSIDC